MTGSAPPRVHHFITQSWIKRFRAADGRLYSHDRISGEIRDRSPAKIMAVFNLHTIDPEGIDDTSLETDEIGRIDNTAAPLMNRVLASSGTEADRSGLASFLAAQIMRDPERLTSYGSSVQDFLRELYSTAFASADFDEFKHFFGPLVTKAEFDHLIDLGPEKAAVEIIALQDEAGRQNGSAVIPFTDLINNRNGRDVLEGELLELNWTLVEGDPDGFILGDTGVLFDVGNIRAGMRVPLSTSAALLLEPAEASLGIVRRPARKYEAAALNCESAARSRRWLAGPKPALEMVRRQVTGRELPTH